MPTAREQAARRQDTPRGIVEFISHQQARGEVERFELHAVSTTSSRFVEDWAGNEGGGEAEQIADLLYARALDDSENSRDVAAVNFEVQSIMVPGEGRPGARKRFVVPMPARVDSRPLEQPDQEGLLSIGMRGLNKGMEMANLFTLENQRQLALTCEKTTVAAAAAEARYNENMDRLTENFRAQLGWKDADILRMQTRLERLEDRAAKTIEVYEELQTEKHKRELETIQVVENEDRKTKVVDLGMKLLVPALMKRYAPGLAATTTAAATPAARNFNENEDRAIHALLRHLFENPELLERVEGVLKGTTAETFFAEMAKTLIEEHIKRSTAAQEASEAHTNGASANGVPS